MNDLHMYVHIIKQTYNKGNNDPRLTISSIQVFEGEAVDEKEKKRENNIKLSLTWADQKREKEDSRLLELSYEEKYAKISDSIDKLAREEQMKSHLARMERNIETMKYNKMLSRNRKANKCAAKEHDDLLSVCFNYFFKY